MSVSVNLNVLFTAEGVFNEDMSNFVLGDDVPNPVLPVTDKLPLTVNPVTVLNKTL